MKTISDELRISIIAVLSLAVILGGIYPLTVWGIAQLVFPHQANGSLIFRDGRIVGSELLAQNFTDAKYFHPRPSLAGEYGYDAANSGASNLGPLSKKLISVVQQRIAEYRAENNVPPEILIPADAVTSSGSGLDPHISINNAELQAARVAQARGIAKQIVLQKMKTLSEPKHLGILGEPRINVTKLNLDLDEQ